MNGKIYAVTGAFGVLGRAVLKKLSASGAKVVAIDIGGDPGGTEAALILSGVDGAEPAEAAKAIANIVENFGRLDGLVNVAGGFTWETIGEGSVESWDRLYRINLRTALVLSQAALGALTSDGGSIVNVGAAGATKASLGSGAYAASKAGVARFTEALAEELKDRGVRVNAVLPTIIDTPANRSEMPDAEFDRWVRPEELANVIFFLLSDEASAITGALIPVSGRV